MARPRARRPAALAGGVVVVAVLAAAAAMSGYLTTDAIRTPSPVATSAAPATPHSYVDTTRSPAAEPTTSGAPATAQGVAAAVSRLLTSPDLGGRLRAQVTDALSGTTLLARGATAPTAPASTAKLLTAAAVLTVHEPTDRFTTRVVRGPGTAVTLVGGGDPTLSAAANGVAPLYPGAARLSDLATAIRRAGVRPSRIVVDDDLFTGPAVSPGWDPEDVPSSYGAAITAVMCDGGRAAPDDELRSATPDLDAGRALAAAVGTPSIPVNRGSAPAGAAVLGAVESAPVSELVAEMLQASDNVIAEVLGRQVALSDSAPASFEGGAHAVRQVLTGLGVDPGPGMQDSSGLAAADRLSASTLAQLVRLAVSAARPRLHPLIAGLPVAAWSGSLAARYTGGSSTGAGVIRAKTGTLTGVSALAGVLRDRSGRLLVFAFMADRTVSTPAAEAALDDIAARLARCGCAG